nr:phage portal protein [uncultured Aminipila sp.]
MRFLENIFGKKKAYNAYTAVLEGQRPLFTSFGTDIYLSDFVNNAIDRIASEIAKVEVRSVVQRENAVLMQNDDLTRLFSCRPNPLQTAGDFLRNVEWERRKMGNAFVFPQYVIIPTKIGPIKKYTALYPLAPYDFKFVILDTGEWAVELYFSDGSQWTFPYSEILHFKWRRGNNTIIGGGDDGGKSNDRDTLKTIEALDKTIQGIPKTIEAALNMSGIFHTKSLAGAEQLTKDRDDFENHIIQSKTGILATTLAGEFTPINKGAATIPDNLLNFLKSVIQEKYGVSGAILSGDYNGEQNAAFYQTAIEDFLVEFEQETTSKLFSPREFDVGHRLKGYYSKINYLSTTDKIQLATISTNTGLMMLNEVGEMFGMAPFEGGNRRIMSLNYISADIADAYQLGSMKKEDATNAN